MAAHLEDSVGDILRKARISTQVDEAAAAAAACVGLPAYQRWEATGTPPPGVDWQALGRLLTLDGGRLRRQSEGWRPAPVDLGQWHHLRQFSTHGNDMWVHAWLAWDPSTREAALFDTGFDATPILETLTREELRLAHLFITHTHADHVAALRPIKQAHPGASLHSSSPNAPAAQRNPPGAAWRIGTLDVQFRETPGHADDGATYLLSGWPDNAPQVAIVGDALFAGSMGGARDKLSLARSRVQEHILSLPASTLVCPGHGPVTTVGEERLNNPWFS